MKYFYSYVLRDRISGVKKAWGDGILLSDEVKSIEHLDLVRFKIIEKLIEEGLEQNIDSVSVHFLALTPLPSSD